MTVTYPLGFRAAAVSAGLRAPGSTALDLALVVNDGPAHAAAGVFTSNRVQAAPVLYTRELLAASPSTVQAVILNAGGANACTGKRGYEDTVATAEAVAAAIGARPEQVAVASTGLIGERLPIATLLAAIEPVAERLSPTGGAEAAAAILTTDSRAKTTTRDLGAVRLGGMAKGAGMLAPGLATMLCVLTTDALLEPGEADAALRAATRTTFERVDSDGCMSTNDTVLLLASGASGERPDALAFTEALTALCGDLSAQLIADAEGATKEIAVTVEAAASEDDALEVARAIARSNLLKCALFGNDPNWGRVLAAIGTTAAAFDPDALDVAINGVWVCRRGEAGAPRSTVELSGRSVTIQVQLHAGTESVTIHTNDLSLAYVHENSAYSS
jgi:glutamate N-acetyltransferase/amino-acid N-acetyltransferase